MYVLVDDWYKETARRLLRRMVGAEPAFSDAELTTLLPAQDFLPFPGETQFLGYIRANYLDLFPRLVDQSQFNRRARALRSLVEELRRHWLDHLGARHEAAFLLDTKPVPVVGYKRSKSHSESGRNLERLLTRTVVGLTTRVIAKVTSHTLKLLLRRRFGIDIQTFQVAGS